MEELKKWKEVAVIVVLIIGWAFTIDGRYLHADEGRQAIEKLDQQGKTAHELIQKQIIVNELKRYDAKEAEGVKLKTWEQLDRKNLERTLTEMSK